MKITNKINPFALSNKATSDSAISEYDHKEFEQWVSDLPIGNVSATARDLHNEIRRLNCQAITPVERFDAMQLMLPAVALVFGKIREHLATKPIPLSGENKLIAKLHLELLVGIVVGYKTVLSQFHDETFTGHFLHRHARAESLRRALFFLSEILLYEYTAYSASPKYVWQEMHGIYHYAVKNDLLVNDVEVDGIVGDLTAEDIYKRALLLALADSGGLLRGEVKKVSEELTDWLPKVALVPVNDEISLTIAFVVDAAKDAPPHAASKSDLTKVKNGWYILTDELDTILVNKLNVIGEKTKGKLRPVDLVPATLYSKLRKRWTPGFVDREDRAKGYGSVHMTCGLKSLHWMLGGWRLQQDEESGITTETEEESIFDEPVLTVDRDEFLINVDAELYAAITAESEQVEEKEESSQESEVEPEEEFDVTVSEVNIEGEKCVCVNASSRGYCLTWSGEGECNFSVGELVGVNTKSDLGSDHSWGLGVIRWMRVQSNGLIGLGVELFEGDMQAIRLDCHYGHDSSENAVLGFLQKINGRVEALITKPFFYGDSDKLLLASVDGQVPVMPGQILECTDAFMRFRARFDSGLDAKKEDNVKKQSKFENVFNNIWDDL